MTLTTPPAAPTRVTAPSRPAAESLRSRLERAVRTVAPLWPLEHFVAVNPYLGRAEAEFDRAAHALSGVAGARTTLPRDQYLTALETGRIAGRHVEQALAEARRRGSAGHDLPRDAEELLRVARTTRGHEPATRVPTVARVLGRRFGRRWSALATARISVWASAYFDRGQAGWTSPWRHLSPYAAWRAEAALDRTPDALGLRGFRSAVRSLPEDALDTAATALERLGVPEQGLDAYLQSLASDVAGWMAYARYLSWEEELRERTHDAAFELLVIRLAWEVALLDVCEDRGASTEWRAARAALEEPETLTDGGPALAVDLVLHDAYELAWREQLLRTLHAPRAGGPTDDGSATRERPDVQAVFCIDVRSEVYRRALEATDGDTETLGFAGFFGFALEYVPLGLETGRAQCPALLTPTMVVPESLGGLPEDAEREAAERRILRRRATGAWRSFKQGAVSCFSFVGPVGLAYVKDLVTDALGIGRPTAHPASDGLSPEDRARLGPDATPRGHAGRRVGLGTAERIDQAEAVLRAMSLTRNFARIVLLAGHGSTTVNNAHATGLDCGACGGHTGEANARVAASVLNDPAVRQGLAERGIDVPADTVFVPALHDTTTDDVRILERDRIPESHTLDLQRLEARLTQASRTARRERAPWLGIRVGGPTGVDAAVRRRSRDWSQVRPEWGLAGCAAFIVARRERTLGRDLAGRAFLHSYRREDDPDLSVLELIMTAPMVVASWISLQYHGSTVDNRVFGCGDKTLHDVVGALGVFEGNGGDLRTGLPWQSVHDGERLVHEPLRLHVVIEAPIADMNTVLERHPDVQRLVDNRWLYLFAMDEDGAVTHRCDRDRRWSRLG